MTVSVGVAHSAGPLADSERLIGAADVLLYAAKNSGRNAVAYRDGPWAAYILLVRPGSGAHQPAATR